MKFINKILLLIYLLSASVAAAESLRMTPSVDICFSSWSGEDENSTNNYSSETTMLGLGLMLQKDKWYGGISIKSSEFDFTDLAPEQDDGIQTSTSTISRAEFDLVAGYYIGPKVAVFLDLKSSAMDWLDTNYDIKFGGLGAGVSGFYPLTNGIFYASFGVVRLTAETGNSEVGSGAGSSLEIGWIYKLSPTLNLRAGLKSQVQVIDYDIAGEQTNRIGGIVVGISKSFSL